MTSYPSIEGYKSPLIFKLKDESGKSENINFFKIYFATAFAFAYNVYNEINASNKSYNITN